MGLGQDDFVEELLDERARQDFKWGQQDHDDPYWYVILGEEFGEVGRAIFEDNPEDVDEELNQVMAVALAWRESRARRR